MLSPLIKVKKSKKYLFKDGDFQVIPSSNNTKIYENCITNGNNTTSCKWSTNEIGDKQKVFVLEGFYRKYDSRITLSSSGANCMDQVKSYSWVDGSRAKVSYAMYGKDLTITLTCYGTSSNQLQISNAYYIELE